MKNPKKLASAIAFLAWLAASAAPADTGARNVVLIHGALVDGSGWRPVYEILKKDGVQHPLTSSEDDVAATRRVLEQIDGPVVTFPRG